MLRLGMRPTVVRCAVCGGEMPGNPLWVEVEGERYPVEDEDCARLLQENPVAALGPQVKLRYRPGCRRCEAKVTLWQEAARRRPLRLSLKPGYTEPCPRLFVEGKEDPITLDIDEIEELLLWLWLQHPGFGGCCRRR